MPCTPEKEFPGSWPDLPLPACRAPTVMDHRTSLLGGSLEGRHRLPSHPDGSAIHLAKKPPPLRIIVPPSEFCPFSTDLTLPITPPFLPTPVSSSCFTFSDRQEPLNHSVSAPPTPTPVPLPCSRDTAIADFASPTSSQFLLMPPTPHLEDTDITAAVRVSPFTTPPATGELIRSGPGGIKADNSRPWQVSSSTWLSDLGGYTETDRIFRHNLLGIASVDTDTSPASTPALSPSALSPSQVSSGLVHNLHTSDSPPAQSPHPYAMSSQPSSPIRLVLKPMGTETFPSTLDSLQAWRESVTPGIPPSEEPQSPHSEDVHDSQLGEPVPRIATVYESLPPRQIHSHTLSPRASRVSKSRSFIKHAKMLGGRVRQLVTRQNVNKPRITSMDRGVNFRVVTSQDSENGSVILIAAPPPPYTVRPQTLNIPQGPTMGQEDVRSRTTSGYSSAVQASMVELSTTGMTESGSRQGNHNRSTLRRLSLAALSTIKRF